VSDRVSYAYPRVARANVGSMRSPRIDAVAARGFARSAEAYERGRPDYPADAIAYLVSVLRLEPGRTALDLAAGTGKLTRRLAETGARVIAVEPVAEMRALLARSLPGVEALDGTAEAIPLTDGSVDAVAVGQGFHWFDGERALADINRVLRPGGRLGLIWNGRDQDSALQARLSSLLEPYRGAVPSYGSGRWRDAFEQTSLFGPLREEQFSWTHETTADGLVDRFASVSFVAALPEAERVVLLERIRALAGPSGEVALPYRTAVYWCERV